MYLFRKIAPFLSLLWPDLHPELLPRVCLIIWYYIYSLSSYSLQTISHCWLSFGNLCCPPLASVTLKLLSFTPSLRHQLGTFFVSSSLPCTSCHLIQCSIFYFSFIKSFHSVRHQWLKPSPHVEDQRQCSNPLLLKTCSVPTVSRIIPWTFTEQEIHEPWQMADSSPREGRKGKSEGVACANTKNLKARWCPWEMVAWPAPSSQGWRLQEWPR